MNVPTSPSSKTACTWLARIFAWLFGRMLAQRVDAVFAEHQRLIAGDVLQPGQVIAEDVLVVQINVEADEIDAPRVANIRSWDNWRT